MREVPARHSLLILSEGSLPALMAIAVLGLKDAVGTASQSYINELATALKDPSVFAGKRTVTVLSSSLTLFQILSTSQSL